MKVTVVGVGLIGGSMALDLKKRNAINEVVGVDKNAEHIAKALELGVIDKGEDLETALRDSDLVIISIPVDQSPSVAKAILDKVEKHTVVMDVGSIKGNICKAIKDHPNRTQFVACHPIAGTEYSGPEAAHYYLFDGKINIITDKERSSDHALAVVNGVFDTLNMKTIFMNSEEHDRHIAFVSHLSHITSFTLGLTVLDIEKSEESIFNMAGSGFASTVRLAKSSPDMWTPIFHENKENLTKAIDAYIEQLNKLRDHIASDNSESTHADIEKSNDISRILDGIALKDENATLN